MVGALSICSRAWPRTHGPGHRAIPERHRHRQTLAGLLASSDREGLIERDRNAQRLLQPVAVVDPYAEALSFRDYQTRARRDHAKYVSLIAAISLLHQHQRPARTVMHRQQELVDIEATREDIQLANQVAHEVLGRTLDELPPQTLCKRSANDSLAPTMKPN